MVSFSCAMLAQLIRLRSPWAAAANACNAARDQPPPSDRHTLNLTRSNELLELGGADAELLCGLGNRQHHWSGRARLRNTRRPPWPRQVGSPLVAPRQEFRTDRDWPPSPCAAVHRRTALPFAAISQVQIGYYASGLSGIIRSFNGSSLADDKYAGSWPSPSGPRPIFCRMASWPTCSVEGSAAGHRHGIRGTFVSSLLFLAMIRPQEHSVISDVGLAERANR